VSRETALFQAIATLPPASRSGPADSGRSWRPFAVLREIKGPGKRGQFKRHRRDIIPSQLQLPPRRARQVVAPANPIVAPAAKATPWHMSAILRRLRARRLLAIRHWLLGIECLTVPR
jgi:hypothetical protein